MDEAQALLQQVSTFSYLGVFVISLLANIFIPVPEEIVVVMIGYGIGTGLFAFAPTLGIVFLGLLISDIVLYFVAKKGMRILTLVYKKYFGALGINNNEEFLKKHINKIIFISRFIIQFRFLGPFLAGHFKVPFKRFLAYEIPALVIYVPFALWLGFYFQSRIDFLIQGIGEVKNIIILVIGIVLLITLLQFFKKRFIYFMTHPQMKRLKDFFK